MYMYMYGKVTSRNHQPPLITGLLPALNLLAPIYTTGAESGAIGIKCLSQEHSNSTLNPELSALNLRPQVSYSGVLRSHSCVPGQSTLLSQCLSPPRGITEYQQIQFRKTILGGVGILLVTSCYRNRDKFWLYGPLI